MVDGGKETCCASPAKSSYAGHMHVGRERGRTSRLTAWPRAPPNSVINTLSHDFSAAWTVAAAGVCAFATSFSCSFAMARDDDGLGTKNGQKRAILYVLALLVVFLEAGLYAARQQSTPRAPTSTWTSSLKRGENSKTIDHPIPKLMAEAEDKFRNLLQRQSKTLDAAVAEYKRRYGRDPPKGFDDWWAFAQSRDVKIIDDYDAINEDLSPFWNFSGAELRRRVSQVRCHC